MEPKNLLFILSDEHTREVTGCYGNEFIRTPNLDALAARGTRFDNAYTNCPICVPARAGLATGRYVHQTRLWDNAHGYDGEVPGWGHRLLAEGHEVTATGKLHYRSRDDPTGWSQEIDTLHIVEGRGDLKGCIRRDMTERGAAHALADGAGPGDSSYLQYDTRVADQACRWIRDNGARGRDRPWVLFVGFVLPHFPLISPLEYFDLYPLEEMPWPRHYGPQERPRHPVMRELARVFAYDDYFDARKVRVARSCYFGMVSCLDHNIGRVLGALGEAGLTEDTRVIYTTDHGDNIGHRGLWGKSVMYEESVAIPMIVAGSGIPPGQRVSEPVSLVDCYQTILEGAGCELGEEERALPGHSLYRIANGDTLDRTIVSEYHAAGAVTGYYMIRHGRYKYIHYVGYEPELYDLEADPIETHNLGANPHYASLVGECEDRLRTVLDPEAVNAQAFADQDAKVAAHGGVEEVLRRGNFGYTPAPGEEPQFA